ncbi:MAG: cupin domain-containing protein [Agriterribacter sp.]
MELSKTDDYRYYNGGYFRTLLSPKQTNNAMALIEFTLPKGAEPPLHIHRDEDESFYILEGELSVRIGDTEAILKPGEAIFAPRSTPHAFTILSGKIKMLNLITPGTLWNFFNEFSVPVAGQPHIPEAQVIPGKEAALQMLQTIKSLYHINFFETK